MKIYKYLITVLLFLITMSFLSLFIWLFCNNIVVVISVWFSALLCSNFAELTSFYLSRIGLTNMKIGDYVLIAKDGKNQSSTRMIGEVTHFINGRYIIKAGKIKLKFNPKTLELVSDDENYSYRFCGITQGN